MAKEHSELYYRAVVHLTKRQDVNQVAEKFYRYNFTSNAKIKIREHSRDLHSITYMVADADEIEPLFLIKPI